MGTYGLMVWGILPRGLGHMASWSGAYSLMVWDIGPHGLGHRASRSGTYGLMVLDIRPHGLGHMASLSKLVCRCRGHMTYGYAPYPKLNIFL